MPRTVGAGFPRPYGRHSSSPSRAATTPSSALQARSTSCAKTSTPTGFGFRSASRRESEIHGLCRFLLLEAAEEFGLYVTPINIDSESPVMPISSPAVYSLYLTKRQGPFATLGLAEDTWALNEHVLGDRHFLQQCLDADHEREKMFFDSLDKVRCGLCVVVFDGTDRLQHMFCATSTRRIRPAPFTPSPRAGTLLRISTRAWTPSSAGRWRSAGARTIC